MEIVHNLGERIKEARLNGWLGEVDGLQTSLDGTVAKLASLDRMQQPMRSPVALGLPVIRRAR